MPPDEPPVANAGQKQVEGVVVPNRQERTDTVVVPKYQEPTSPGTPNPPVVPKPEEHMVGIPITYSEPACEERLRNLESAVLKLTNQIEALVHENAEFRAKLETTLIEHGNLLANITTKAEVYGKASTAASEESLAEVRKILLWLEMNAPRKEGSLYYEAMNPMLITFFMNLFEKYTGQPFEEIMAEITNKDIKVVVNKMIKEKGGD